MIRYYCDICSTEIDKPEGQITGGIGRVAFSITRAVDGTWNGGQVCRSCIIAAINADNERKTLRGES